MWMGRCGVPQTSGNCWSRSEEQVSVVCAIHGLLAFRFLDSTAIAAFDVVGAMKQPEDGIEYIVNEFIREDRPRGACEMLMLRLGDLELRPTDTSDTVPPRA